MTQGTVNQAESLPLTGGTLTGDLILNGNPITGNQAANKSYVDTFASGMTFLSPCYAGTTTDLGAVTYNNGAAGVGATLINAGSLAAFSVDGVSPPLNSRVLIKNQSTAAQNGIYILSTVGSGAVAWILTRATDYDQASEMVPGSFVITENGTQANLGWVQTATITTVGTDPLTFAQFGGSSIQSVTGTAGQIDVTAGSNPVVSIDSAYTGQSSINTLGTIVSGVWSATAITGTTGQIVRTVDSTNVVLTANAAQTFWGPATTITPASVNSTFIILGFIAVNVGITGSASGLVSGSMHRGVSNISGTSAGFSSSVVNTIQTNIPLCVYDSPATTSSVTYQMKGNLSTSGGGSASGQINPSGTSSVMLVVEIL